MLLQYYILFLLCVVGLNASPTPVNMSGESYLNYGAQQGWTTSDTTDYYYAFSGQTPSAFEITGISSIYNVTVPVCTFFSLSVIV
jgi:hypothetical protein